MKPARFFGLLKRHKRPMAAFSLLVMVLPPFEVLSVSLVFLLLSPERAADVLARVASAVGLESPITEGAAPYVVLALVAAVVGVLVLGRRARVRYRTSIKYDIYEDEIAGFVARFLALPGWAELKEDSDEIAGIMVHQIGSISVYFFSLMGIISSSASIVMLTAASVFYSPVLTLIALVLGAVSILINRKSFAILGNMGSRKVESQRELLSEVQQLMMGFERIKFDSLEPDALRRLRGVHRRSRTWRVDKSLTTENVLILSDSFSAFSVAVIVFAGVVFFGLDAAIFVVLLLMFARIRTYFNLMQGHVMSLRELRPSVALAVGVLDRLDGYDRETPTTVTSWPARLNVSSASFSYDGTPALQDVNLEIGPGDRVLVIGPSGQGKSTMLKMLAGYYPPDSGEVTISWEGGSEPLSFEGVRSSLFYCSSDLYIFDGSIRDAVDYGSRASDDAVREALAKVFLLDLVGSTPGGLDASVGPNGESLSLGQRQRLLLARLFLREPYLVLLDEATSNIDTDTESKIFKNIEDHLDPQAILIVVAHRETDAIEFNRVISVRGGRVSVLDQSLGASRTAV